jgi:hypothetical protein
MKFVDRMFVFLASVFVGLFLFSIVGTEASFLIPAFGLGYVILGGKRP